jgi:hypothetical protein
LGGKFEKVILALMETPYNYLAQELRDAMAKVGTNEDVLTEVVNFHLIGPCVGLHHKTYPLLLI